MLRRKMLTILGSVALLLVLMAVVALWPLQAVFHDLDRINNQAVGVADLSGRLNNCIFSIEVELYRLQLGTTHQLDGLISEVEQLKTFIEQTGKSYVVQDEDCGRIYRRLVDLLPVFERHVSALATAQDVKMMAQHNLQAQQTSAEMRRDIQEIVRFSQNHLRQEQDGMTRRFRWSIVGLGLGFLLVINLSVMVLLRLGKLVLQPVEKLLEASRQLALEHFDYRVELVHHDEFDELALAHNRLAKQLQENELRKIEMLGQVSLTLNHELNNAMAIIDLQMALLTRRSSGNPAFEKCLRQIDDNLRRMARTVESLKRVRRIVLTDYVGGVKMLDLPQSLLDAPRLGGAALGTPAVTDHAAPAAAAETPGNAPNPGSGPVDPGHAPAEDPKQR